MARCTSPVWISITNGSDKHKQSILFRKVIIQSYNTSSSATSSYTLQQEWMIPHEQDFPYTTSNRLKCQQSKKKRQFTILKGQLNQAHLFVQWSAQSLFFVQWGWQFFVVVGLCPPVVSKATLKVSRKYNTFTCSVIFLVTVVYCD